jgi:WD40 repeat protein
VRIYSCSSGDLQSVLQESPDTLASLAFNATSPHSQIYSVTRNGRLVVWNYEEGIAVKAYDLKSPTFGVYSPNRNGAIFVLLKTHSKSPGKILL